MCGGRLTWFLRKGRIPKNWLDDLNGLSRMNTCVDTMTFNAKVTRLLQGVVVKAFHNGSMNDLNPYRSPSTASSTSANSKTRPLWVKLVLWGVGSRRIAVGYQWFTFIAGLASCLAVFWYPTASLSVTFFVCSILYWWSIRWMDANDEW